MKTVVVSITPVSKSKTVTVLVPLIDPETGEERDDTLIEMEATKRACEKLYGRGSYWWDEYSSGGEVRRKIRGVDRKVVTADLSVQID